MVANNEQNTADMAHILVVDDSPTERHFISKLLEQTGHKVSTADSGEEGVEAAKDIHPDLILMDIVMPGMNGFQATRQITQAPETAEIPVVMVSTKSQQTDKVWATRQGAKGYLVKPVDSEMLVNSIKSFLAA
jgi:twitching motility two-component system response regulator PilH